MPITFDFLANFFTPVKLGGQSEKCYDRVCPVCHSWNDTSTEVVWCCRDDTAPALPTPCVCAVYTFISYKMWKGSPTHLQYLAVSFASHGSSDCKRWRYFTVRQSYCHIYLNIFGNGVCENTKRSTLGIDGAHSLCWCKSSAKHQRVIFNTAVWFHMVSCSITSEVSPHYLYWQSKPISH